ncbi:MAG: hypothetical protein COS99_01080 [Candidatus Omnitrophica bacterium CG07_land_8_20_14_0_80_42_15]|uniref:Class I SAM-dependent methyltransferase n=1 Tax=Candidatus Aquitaenariimonas noxiae TaxID=1974741 RepID=A0A2J0L6R7_9BACT|nr:MAG: hypothetical protein COS99_01080 [Candidatus Omnitrophica bacterium CG07_land_8_20_14_0_80_42_15]
MKIVESCPVCGNSNIKCLYKKTFLYPGNGIQSNLLDINYERLRILFDYMLKGTKSACFAFIICKNCGFVFLNPRFEDREMELKYDAIRQLGLVQARLSLLSVRSLKRRSEIIYNTITKYKNKKVAGFRILDFGGGGGYNLRLFAKNNLCYIVDYEKPHLQGDVKYLCQTADEITQEIKFDIILCCHVLEHVADPVKILQKLASHLVPNGILYIEIPFECFPSKFKNLQNPLTHINFFSPSSLLYLLSSCGFGVKKRCGVWKWLIQNQHFWLSVISEKNGQGLPKYGAGYRDTVRCMSNPLLSLCARLGDFKGGIYSNPIY